MTFCILFCHSIPATYESKELKAPMARQDRLDWNLYPVKITSTEMSAMKLEKVLEILEGVFTLPSKMVGIKENERCPVARQIDDLYQQCHQDYMNSLDICCCADAATIQSWHKSYGLLKECARPLTIFLGVCASSAAVISQFSKAIKRGQVIAVAAAAGAILLIDQMTREYILRNGSTHRIKWMLLVDVEEKSRIRRSAITIEERISTIQKQQSELGNETDAGLVRELDQLNLIKTLFTESNAS
jgi:hypothetical protein